MKHATHRLIIAGVAALLLAKIMLVPGVSEAWRSDFREPCKRCASEMVKSALSASQAPG
jgi:hypothetical protein